MSLSGLSRTNSSIRKNQSGGEMHIERVREEASSSFATARAAPIRAEETHGHSANVPFRSEHGILS